MIVAIIVGVVLGALLWHIEPAGAFFGGVAGWLIWKVISMEAAIKKLQVRLPEAPKKEAYESLKAGSLKEDVEPVQTYVDLPPYDAPVASLPSNFNSSSPSGKNMPGAENPQPVMQSNMASTMHAKVETSWEDEAQTFSNNTNRNNTSDFEPEWQQSMDRFSARFDALLAWFVSGNMLVRIGSIVLFFGAGFLLKYAAEHSQLSIEIRMFGIVLGACVMLGVGWYLRTSRPVYGLALQGGGLGLLYLTIYASFRLYDLLAASHALILLALIAGAGVAMAVIYNARWLAILSFAGGFLAPVLASTGSGSHVALFSWYAVLNVGIAVLAWHKAWRSLNLLGMVATFIIAALWGNQYYRLSFFDSVEPFLVGFGLLYLAIGVLFSLHRADPEQEGFGRVDASIIFGTPIGFFLLQTPLVHHFEHGMSLSALFSGLVYVGAAWWAYRKENNILMLALISIAVTLLTLAIPLEFDEAETAAAWAMEGVGLLWLGLVQKSQRALFTGMVLQGLAAGCWLFGSPLLPSAGYGSALSVFLIGLSGWMCAVLLGKHIHWEKDFPGLKTFIPTDISFGFQIWGLFWWLVAGLTELHRHVHDHDLLLSAIVWVTVSAWLVEGLGLRLCWQKFRSLNSGLIFLWLIGLFIQSGFVNHPAQDWSMLAWVPALLTTYWMLYRNDQRSVQVGDGAITDTKINLFHVVGVCFALLFLIWEFHWQVSEWLSNPKQIPIWADVVPGVVTALLLIMISSNDHRWPVVVHGLGYLKVSAMICVLVLVGWFVWMLPDPVDVLLPYIPLFNVLDLVFILAGLAIYSWWKALQKNNLVWFEAWQFYLAIGVAGFISFNMDVARVVHHWFDIAWGEHAMMHSVELQAGLSLSWSVLALVLMSWASRRRLRVLWIGGAVLLALVVIKLFVIDMSGTGTLARIVSFLGVGGLLLVIGYLSPLPPESDKINAGDFSEELGDG